MMKDKPNYSPTAVVLIVDENDQVSTKDIAEKLYEDDTKHKQRTMLPKNGDIWTVYVKQERPTTAVTILVTIMVKRLLYLGINVPKNKWKITSS